MKHTQIYLKSEDLAVELERSQQQGSPTEKVCQYFQLIATHLLGDSRYRNYPNDLQADMVGDAILKMIKNIKNYKPEFKSKCFNYFTRCAECSFWTTLGKHYQQVNMVRELTLEYANKIESINPLLAQQIRDSQIEVKHTKEKANYRKRGNKNG